MIRGLLVAFALLQAMVVWGQEGAVHPFVSGSLGKITAARAGKPFILSFWSLGCTHCPVELKALGELKRRHPQLDIVLVSTDTPEDSRRLAQLAHSYGLVRAEQWVFADPMPERLRFEIDRRWYGELPRTHFYDRNHRIEAVSGLVPEARLQQWMRDNL